MQEICYCILTLWFSIQFLAGYGEDMKSFASYLGCVLTLPNSVWLYIYY